VTPLDSPHGETAVDADPTSRSATVGPLPADHAARRRIRQTLDRTILAAAGAGSGKTTHLVERMCELVVRGRARVDQLAVISFTDAAAGELRDRVAEALETIAKSSQDALAAQRAADALGDLDGAAITTLHGFARRILAAHPFEAGLPATFDVMDEARSLSDSDEQWHGCVTALLDDDDTARAVLWLIATGVDVGALRPVLRQLGDNWDRIAAQAGTAAEPAAEAGARPLAMLDPASVLVPLCGALELAQCCTDPDDALARHLDSLRAVAERLREAQGDELALLELLAAPPSFGAGNKGKAGAWGGRKPELRELLEEAQRARGALLGAAVDAAIGKVAARLCELTLGAARRRRHEGRLHYHDLLVLSCALVREHPDVRASLHEEYRAILVDEFQDTDPLQAELVCMIAAAPSADVALRSWWDLPIEDGALFFVGDPLQSIYGFRRADIATFLRVRTDVAKETASLVANFRSVPGIVDWVNAVFGALVGAGDGTLQPPHEPAVPARTLEAPTPVPERGAPAVGAAARAARGVCDPGPSVPVTLLGARVGEAPNAEAARAREAEELAALLDRALREGWRVGRRGRPVQPDDIAVLVPSRRSVPALEAALDAVQLPYRLESSSLVYSAPEVADLLQVLRAVDDPSDPAAVVAALRTPGYGCGDDDLVRYRLSGGSWDYRTVVPPDDGDPVRRGLADLLALHEERAWIGVSELVARVVEERRQLGAALDSPRWREEWRRLRFVADQARQFAEGSSGGLRDYLAWVGIQLEDGARVTEIVLPEADAPAVAIMTVHAAKGLEFPVVAVAGLGSAPQGVRYPAALFGPDGLEIGVKSARWTAGFERARQREELVYEHERLRLLYVAVTRAQNHLVVSLHRGARAGRSTAARLESVLDAAEGLWRAPDDPVGPDRPIAPNGMVSDVPDAAGTAPDAATATVRGAAWATAPEELDRWTRARDLRLAPTRHVVAATSVATLAAGAPGGAPSAADTGVHRGGGDGEEGDGEEGDGETPRAGALGAAAIWRRGRGGTAVGRAVHEVLQTVDLATGDRLDPMAVVHATREGVPAQAGEIASLARVALASDVVRRAVSGRYWRELYVGVPIGARVLEGFVDLLFEGPDGLEVVDYKTDRLGPKVRVEDVVARYRLQGAAYAYAVGEVTGRPVVNCTFLFLRADRAVEAPVPGLVEAMEEVRRLVGGQSPAPGMR
jgi:ATP-dependent exoDNAse (exonuclease V) beta subunit